MATSMSAHRIPGAVAYPEGWAVRPLKRYASWVQNVVRQFESLSGAGGGYQRGAVLSTRGMGWTDTAGASVGYQIHGRVAKSGRDKR